jgi:hypothetical protein
MAEPIEHRTIGSAWCPCGKHKAKEQAVCVTCFASLPLLVKYGLASLRLEIREKSIAFALENAKRNGEPKFATREGNLFK